MKNDRAYPLGTNRTAASSAGVGDATPALLELHGIGKRFDSTIALDNVSLRLRAAEVLGLVGENGAGKSTLMRILAGVEVPDAGTISLAGEPVSINTPSRALQLGIAIIHQEIHLCPNLDLAANVFLGRERHRYGWIDGPAMHRDATSTFRRIGLTAPSATLAGSLSIGRQQLVEIARALAMQARILILDEPTASLSAAESENLFRLIDELRSDGVAMIYISHRLGEIERMADRVTVLRDGRNAGELARDEIDHLRMVRLMVGRDVPIRSAAPSAANDTIDEQTPSVATPRKYGLAIEQLRTRAFPHQAINLTVERGETVGLAGLIGAGRSELLQAIFGIELPLSGTVRVDGQPVSIRHPADATKAGISLVPEDRKSEGLVLSLPVEPNVAMASLDRRVQYKIFADDSGTRAAVRKTMQQLHIRAASLHQQPVQFLSGGNQQKVVLGKWLLREPIVLLMDEPTRGVDVGARAELYQQLAELKQRGAAILFASSEMEEVLTLADRIVVMHQGAITGELAGAEATEEAVMLFATGSTPGRVHDA